MTRYGLDQKELGMTHLNLSRNLIGGTPYQSGALFSFAHNPNSVILRVGVSFVSAEQACENAETEVGTSNFDEVMNQSKALWQDKLGRIELDVANTPPNVTELLYSSLYRSFLTPVSLGQKSSYEMSTTFSDQKISRIMPLVKARAHSQTRQPHISTPFIAGRFPLHICECYMLTSMRIIVGIRYETSV